MSIFDKAKHEAEEWVGKAKEAVGNLSGDKDLSAEGKGDQASSHLKQAGDTLSDKASEATDTAKDKAGEAKDKAADVAKDATEGSDKASGEQNS